MKSRKIPMERRKTAEQISVTLSKRRQGLFNKAAQLAMFCDSQIAVLVSAPNKRKVCSFGHTSVPSVLRAFLGDSAPVPDPIGGVFVSDFNGSGSVAEALSDLDDFERSESVEELERLVEGLENLTDNVKRSNCGTGTSKSVLDLGFDCGNNGEMFGILEESAAIVAEPANIGFQNAYSNYVTEESNLLRGEEVYWGCTGNDNEVLLNNDYQDSMNPYIDCWPSSSRGFI